MKKLLAIDPGKSGGLAWSDGESITCLSIPQTDGDILDLLRSIRAGGVENCHIEHVVGFVNKASPGNMFAFGEGFGFLKGCLMSLGYRIYLHRPQKWQKALSLGAKKDHGKGWKNHLKGRAQQLFPSCKITNDTADALLIFSYGQSLP